MTTDYIFPNEENQWAVVPQGSSSDDPCPSTIFSNLNHNKSVNPQAKTTTTTTQVDDPIAKRSCSITARTDISAFRISIMPTRESSKEDWSFTRVCNDFLNITGLNYQLKPVTNTIYPSSLENLITEPNRCIGKIINQPFAIKNYEKESIEYESYNTPELSPVCTKNISIINAPFVHNHMNSGLLYSFTESALENTGFSGCRSENIGKETLQEVFGTKYVIVISCKYLLVTTVPEMNTVCNSYPVTTYNTLQSNTVKFECRSLTVNYSCSRPCNLFINGKSSPLQYGRFNSMVMMPVFPDYGRMSG